MSTTKFPLTPSQFRDVLHRGEIEKALAHDMAQRECIREFAREQSQHILQLADMERRLREAQEAANSLTGERDAALRAHASPPQERGR